MSTKLPPPPPGAERRKHERFDVLAQVQVRSGGEVVIMPIANISAGGVLLSIDGGDSVDLKPGDAVTVYIDLEPEKLGQRLAVDVPAEVVRINLAPGLPGSGVALMWTTQDPRLMASLSKILARMTQGS